MSCSLNQLFKKGHTLGYIWGWTTMGVIKNSTYCGTFWGMTTLDPLRFRKSGQGWPGLGISGFRARSGLRVKSGCRDQGLGT